MKRFPPIDRPTPDLTRRDFLRLTAAAGAAAALAPLAASAAANGSKKATDTLNLRAIPASGEKIPVIGLGTSRTFDVDPADEAALEPLLGVMREFHGGGGRLIDSSPMYGHAETVTGILARRLEIADELFMATKVWTEGREAGIAQMEQSRERMGGGPLELVQVHNLVDLQTHLKTLRAWREEGRVRYIGVTHWRTSGHDELIEIVENEPIDFVQLNYNIAERAAAERLLPAAADRGVATLINRPFQRAALFGKVRGHSLPAWAEELGIATWAQFFLKFIVGHPAVTCAIPATSDPEHAADNVGAAHGPLPDAKQRERMARTFEELT